MARTVDSIVKSILGDQIAQIATLVAENESLKEQLDAFKAETEAKTREPLKIASKGVG